MPVMLRTLAFSFILFFSLSASAQDTLPRFSVTARGPGKILVSWHNRYPKVSQISIQRSSDSLRNFTTLLTVPDPHLPENGAMDLKAIHPNFYYRLFIVLEEGKYLFTAAKKPQTNTGVAPNTTQDDTDESDAILARTDHQRVMFLDPQHVKGTPQIKSPSSIQGGLREIEVQKTVYIKKGETVLTQIPGNRIRAFRDSLLTKTKDTLIFIDGDSLLIRPFVPKEIYRASSYVFTGKYGNIQVALPDAAKKHYAVKFFDEENKLLFEISAIKAPSLILDKSNFLHAGWFRFELYEDGQLKEKNRFFIPKEF
ncbi:hypothetical protein Q4E93_17835 [Flavitalea sp. BT771]|uniref:hypothetical protein n=1 Tax=Flavitalea sp. BT771 TaxID=3063329 RepID=UPI0026E1DA46|nr:hypothetical protein [Flavitalea sp. BT771]MDO6432470.1 hypothetical protein [Flavitalea sp. BT771]MDV6221379.1 hypothetical protein [Flavitalea sp. BT771]